MGDGVQDHCLGRVRLAGGLGLGRRGRRPLALGGDVEQAGERRRDAVQVRLVQPEESAA